MICHQAFTKSIALKQSQNTSAVPAKKCRVNAIFHPRITPISIPILGIKSLESKKATNQTKPYPAI